MLAGAGGCGLVGGAGDGVAFMKHAKGKNKKRRFDAETGKGNGYTVGRERFAGFARRTDGLKMDGFNDVRRACDAWLDKNEDRSAAFERGRFNYGRNAKA